MIPAIDIEGRGSCSECKTCHASSVWICVCSVLLASSVGQCIKVLPVWLTPILLTCRLLSVTILLIFSMSALPDVDGLTKNDDLSFCIAPVFVHGFLCVDHCGPGG